MTHYVAAFVEATRWPRAVCGASLRFMGEHSTEPECRRCQEWLAADTDTITTLPAKWAEEDRLTEKDMNL